MLTTTQEKKLQPLQLLTHAQKEKYLRDGFLIIPNFFSQDICDMLIQQTNKLIAAFDPEEAKVIFSTRDLTHQKQKYFLDSADKIRFFLEEKALDSQNHLIREKQFSINKIGHALHDLDPVFYCFSRLHRLALLAKDLDIIDPLILQSMIVCKQPYIGGEVNCHQDNTFMFVENKSATGFWFALQDATVDNGCLWAIPGGHLSPLKSRLLRVGDELRTEVYDSTPWDLEKMVALPVARGSIIVLHGLLPHMSYENRSHQSRYAYTLHLMSHNDQYAANNWLQREKFTGF